MKIKKCEISHVLSFLRSEYAFLRCSIVAFRRCSVLVN